MCLPSFCRIARHITRYTKEEPNDSSDSEPSHPLVSPYGRCRTPSPLPSPPRLAQPWITQPHQHLLDHQPRRMSYGTNDESLSIPAQHEHPARERFMSQVLAHGLPGLEGREAYTRRYTGLGADYIWEDLEREYGDLADEPVRLRRSNAFRGPRNTRRGQAFVRAATGRAIETPGLDAGSVAPLRSDSAQPKVIADVPGIRDPFEDIVETAEDQAEMDGWVDECCADDEDGPRVQQVPARQSPTLVHLARVQSQRAVLEHVDNAQSGASATEEVDEESSDEADVNADDQPGRWWP